MGGPGEPRDEVVQPQPVEAKEPGWFERAGDVSAAVASGLAKSPAAGIAIVTVLLYVVIRIPTEVFYSRFGVRPEEAGLNSVQVLLQGASTVLILSLGVGLAYGLLMPLLMLVYYRGLRRVAAKALEQAADDSEGQKAEGRLAAWGRSLAEAANRRPDDPHITRTTLRVGMILVPLITVAFSLLILLVEANEDADKVERGSQVEAEFGPWKAERVSVIWTEPEARIALPGCRHLFYLGEGDGRTILFDSLNARTYRVNGDAVQLGFPSQCG